MHRKGFIQIAEIIIILLAAFMVIVQLQSLPRPQTDWTAATLAALGSDVLASLDEAGVNWFNASDIFRLANGSLPAELLIGVRLTGPAKTNVSVGCICSSPETIRQALADLPLNNRTMTFTVTPITETGISPVYDVIVLTQKPNQLLFYQDYLAAGRGVVEITDLTPADITPVQQLFGLSAGGPAPTGSFLSFSSADQPNSTFYPLFKYYNLTPDMPVTITGFLSPTETILPTGQAKAVLKEPSGAAGLIVQDTGSRTAWLSAGPQTVPFQSLTRSLVLWAAGNEQTIISLPASTSPPVRVSRLSVANNEAFEIVQVELSLGTAF